MKPKPLLALNHFTVPCSLLTALLFSVNRVTAEHNIKLSDAQGPEPLNRAAAVFKLRSGEPQSGLANKKMAASVTLRPLYYPKAIQEQQTQGQSTTGGGTAQVISFVVYCATQSAFVPKASPDCYDARRRPPWIPQTSCSRFSTKPTKKRPGMDRTSGNPSRASLRSKPHGAPDRAGTTFGK